MLVNEPVTFVPLPTIVSFPDVNIVPPLRICTPLAFPAIVLLLKITVDWEPSVFIAACALRIITL